MATTWEHLEAVDAIKDEFEHYMGHADREELLEWLKDDSFVRRNRWRDNKFNEARETALKSFYYADRANQMIAEGRFDKAAEAICNSPTFIPEADGITQVVHAASLKDPLGKSIKLRLKAWDALPKRLLVSKPAHCWNVEAATPVGLLNRLCERFGIDIKAGLSLVSWVTKLCSVLGAGASIVALIEGAGLKGVFLSFALVYSSGIIMLLFMAAAAAITWWLDN